MFDIKFRTPEIQEKGLKGDSLVLVADIPQTVKLFQGQRLKVKTGVAMKTDNHAFAMALRGNNEMGLVLACGMELVSDQDGEVEILMWNRNAQGTPRMIEITPMMPIAQLLFMPAAVIELPKVEQEETETQPETEKTLEQLGIKDLRAILDMKAQDQGIETAMYKQKDTKSELIALIRGSGNDGQETG